MKIKKRHILAIFLLAFVGLNIISMSSVFLLAFTVQPSFAVDYEEEDIQQFADSDLRNVTVILDTSGGAGIGASVDTVNGLPAQFTLDQVLVRISTLDYIPSEWKNDPITAYTTPFLHNVFSSKEKILSFAQSRFSGGFGVRASIDSVDIAAGIQSMAALMEEANHTSEAWRDSPGKLLRFTGNLGSCLLFLFFSLAGREGFCSVFMVSQPIRDRSPFNLGGTFPILLHFSLYKIIFSFLHFLLWRRN